MSPRLEELVGCAREAAPSFDRARSLAGARAKRESRARRDRVLRRAVVLASGASFVLVLLLRASSSPASLVETPRSALVETPRSASPRSSGMQADEGGEIAAHALDDGGFARD